MKGNAMDRCGRLGNGIIIQAINDYGIYMKRLEKNPSDTRARDEIESIEKFFYSDLFEMITKLDPTELIVMLEKKCEEGKALKINTKRRQKL